RQPVEGRRLALGTGGGAGFPGPDAGPTTSSRQLLDDPATAARVDGLRRRTAHFGTLGAPGGIGRRFRGAAILASGSARPGGTAVRLYCRQQLLWGHGARIFLSDPRVVCVA